LPGSKYRLELLKTLAQSLPESGLLIFSLWQFKKDPRLASRIIPNKNLPTYLDPRKLESGDYLLDWRRDQSLTTPQLRYCHHFSDPEIDQLISDLAATTHLQLLSRFVADGPKTHPLNCYLVFQKQSK